MTTEDYVSFEIAKLLKEKGFVGESEIGCRCGFYKQNKEYPNQINLVYDDLNNSELEWNECLRFTHQMAMKWLREVRNVFIEIHFWQDTYEDVCCEVGWKEPTYNYRIIGIGNNDADHVDIDFNSYESACEAAIKYCLEHLI